jgi:nucleoside-diphosphate-sugar epimerase
VGALDPVRDLVYVSDTVDGFLAAAECDGVEGQVFNLGTGVGTRIGDLAEAVVRLVGGDAKIEQEARRLRPRVSEVDRLVADATAARERLGWSARVPLAEGLRRTATWIRSHPEAFRSDDFAV